MYTIVLKKAFFILLAIVFIHCNSEAQKQLVVQGSSTAACFGASSANNSFNDYDSCWLGRLGKYYNTLQPTTVHQVAQGGYSPYQGMPSGYTPPVGRPAPDPTKNISYSLSFGADVIIISYPSNGYNSYSVTEVMARLRTIHDSATRFGKTCYIMTPQPRFDAPYNNSFTKKNMWEIKDSVMQQFGYYAINVWDSLVNTTDTTLLAVYNSGDNIHVNNAGHAFLSRAVISKDIFNVSLPLQQLQFSTSMVQGMVNIYWKYLSYKTVNNWELQRSKNGIHFETIFSTSAAVDNYAYTDQLPLSGKNYYRLKANMKDGKKEFSVIKMIALPSPALQLEQKGFTGDDLILKLYSPTKQQLNIQVVGVNGIQYYLKMMDIKKGETMVTLRLPPMATNNLMILQLQAADGSFITEKIMRR